MKKFSFVILGFILAAALSPAPAGRQAGQALAADQAGQSPPAVVKRGQVYFPGDTVHIVVEAPMDTDSVSAVMPDGQELSMFLDRRTKVWHNYWQVPVNFKKGTYTAKLTAVDVEGRNFEGETAPIFVEEPTMPVVMRFAPSGKVKPAAAAPAPAAARAKFKSKEEFNVARMRYILLAKDFMAKQEYEKAKAQLEALLEIDPGNAEVKLMLSRIEVLIKARKTI